MAAHGISSNINIKNMTPIPQEMISRAMKEAFRNSIPATHWRQIAPAHFSDVGGWAEPISVADNMQVMLADLSIDKPVIDSILYNNCLVFQFILQGNMDLAFEGYSKHHLSGPRFFVCTYPGNIQQTRTIHSGQKLKYLTIWINPATFSANFSAKLSRLPSPIRNFLGNSATTPSCLSMPLTPRLQKCLNEIYEADRFNALKNTFQHAKITEMICEALYLLSTATEAPDAWHRWPHADRQAMQIQAAAEILTLEIETPPSLQELSRRVGLNTTKLSKAFRQMYGATPSEYSKKCRMEAANSLLSSGNARLAEVALSVGFSDQSTFSRAFKDYFGISPRSAVLLSASGPSHHSEVV